MPSSAWCLANTDRIRWSHQWVAKRLEPIAPDRIDKALAVLAATTKHAAGEDPATWDVRAKEYRRLLSGYSAEVWMHAIDEHRKRSPFWPSIAELEALMKPKANELRVSEYRLRKMLEAKPEAPPPAGKRFDELTEDERAELDAKVREVMKTLNANTEAA